MIGRDAFVDALLTWFHARGDASPGFGPYWPVKGGWEAWIQVEVAAFLLQRDPTADVAREVGIYASSKKRVDLLLDGATPAHALAVETKAQSFYNRDRFVKGVLDDRNKLDTERVAPWTSAAAIALGIAFDQGAVHTLIGTPAIPGWTPFQQLGVTASGEVALVAALTL